MDSAPIIVRCRVLRKTDKAILIKHEDPDLEFWMPKSVIVDEIPADPGWAKFVIKRWFAEQKGVPLRTQARV